MSKCRTPYCRGNTTKTGRSPYCARCRSRRWKEKNPMRYAFIKLRYRAKERGHAFELTFEDYLEFARQTGYDKLKGKTAHSLSIHRRYDRKGYTRDNIAAVTLSTNSKLRYSNMPDWLRAEMEEAERQSVLNELAEAQALQPA